MYMTNVPPPDILESTFRKKRDRIGKLKEVMKMYGWEIDQKGAKPSYDELRKLVDTKIETSRLAKASLEYDVTKTTKCGAAVKSESDNKPCKYWNSRGVCNRGESCAFWHDPAKKA